MILRGVRRVLWTVLGLVVAAAAVFAPELGLDPNDDWGPSRRLLLATGGFLVLLGWRTELLGLVRRAFGAVGGLAARAWGTSGLASWSARMGASWRSSSFRRRALALAQRAEAAWLRLLGRSRLLRRLFGARRARVTFAAWVAFLLVVLSYVWFVSVGTWTHWPAPSAYHDMQAAAFLRGQLHLLREPEPDLMALEDPYDPAVRVSVHHLWDASLYNGRYYLYWGPVPALLEAPVKAAADVRVGDDVLVFVFLAGSMYWITRLLLRVWKDHFTQVPGWAVVACVLVAGWANPGPWMLNSPWVYEAAIAGGQMFLLMGIYALYPFLALSAGSTAGLMWAGASFALAVGTRASLAVAVGVVVLIVVLRIFVVRREDEPAPPAWRLAAFFLPLVLGALVLAGYNQSRFDSPFEFGQRYQLTSLNLQRIGSGVVSIRNVPPNLYNYLVNPVRTLPVFPYVKPFWGGKYMSAFRLPVPEDYYSRQITGLLVAAPFSLFSLTCVAHLRRRVRKQAALADRAGDGQGGEGMIWIEAVVLAVTLAGFVVAQLYVVASMRYLGDFMPGMMLLASIGLWRGLSDRRDRGAPAGWFGLLGALSMASTAIAGLLLGITSSYARFEVLNPTLFDWLTRLFTP